MHDVEALVGFSRQHIYRLVKADTFPKPFYLGDNSLRFLERDILAWIQAKIEESRRGDRPKRPRGRKPRDPAQRPWCTPDDASAEEPDGEFDQASEDELTDA